MLILKKRIKRIHWREELLYYLSFHPTGLEEKKRFVAIIISIKRHKGMSPMLFKHVIQVS